MALPKPEPGLIVNYAYLWHRERQHGAEEGRKDRPVVIILALRRAKRGTTVIVLPVTHTPPIEVGSAVSLPAAVKRHLGLDGEESWIVVSEGNEFLWPGYDLRPRDDGTYAYGFLPPRLFNAVRKAFVAFS